MAAQLAASSRQRARRSFWMLLLIAIVAAGSLTSAFAADASPVTGVRVAVSGVLLLGSLAMAARVMIAYERARRRAIPDAARHEVRPVFGRGNLWKRK